MRLAFRAVAVDLLMDGLGDAPPVLGRTEERTQLGNRVTGAVLNLLQQPLEPVTSELALLIFEEPLVQVVFILPPHGRDHRRLVQCEGREMVIPTPRPGLLKFETDQHQEVLVEVLHDLGCLHVGLPLSDENLAAGHHRSR